ncbi:MAG: L-threonylcarbamoyladenylate synthase [Eubacteriales bacterium]|nr:L-threonylcarbamoyladenylate synthase [Eubacteriales bacterium]
METKLLEPTHENIKEAARIIKAGGLVAFPTETVYGLGADAMNAEAVASVYKAKGRPSDNPLIVHIAEISDMAKLTPVVTDMMNKLAKHFWPGPLTMVVKKTENVPEITTGGLDTVAVRLPDNKNTRELIAVSGCPLVGPSANISGKPSPTKAAHVVDDLCGKIDAVLMGEDCRVGIESTVLDVSGEELTILRPGILTAEQIENSVGVKVNLDPALIKKKHTIQSPDRQKSDNGLLEDGDPDFKPRAPGMKYRHYAPNAEMLIIEGSADNVKKEIEQRKAQNEAEGKKVGVILFDSDDFEEAAHELFDQLRMMDKTGVDLILAGALPSEDGRGFAIMNRMLKSAGNNIVKV